MKPRLVRLILCPLCGYRMGKGDIRPNGFRCPSCGEWLHVDTDASYTIAKIAAWAYILAFWITAIAGLTWRGILLWTLGLPTAIIIAGNFIMGWFCPKLARGVVPRGKVSLRVTPPDDPPKKE
jgi:hypothetical protein